MKRRKLSTLRLALVFFCVVFGWIILIARFAQIQIVEASRCERLVADQCWGQLKLSAKRGCIYDRNGNLLAFDMASETFYTYAADMGYLRKLARSVSRLAGDADLVSRVMERPGKFNSLARLTSPELATKIRALNCDSIYSYPEFLRVYRYGSLACDILGQIDVDNNGISGVELEYDERLKPEPGLARFQRDGKGRIYRISDTPIVRPRDGCELRLTMDVEYQQIVEEELRRAVEKWDANSGMAVFIEAETGRVLAADCYTHSSLNKEEARVFKSKFVTDLFEPGSTYKLVACAGLLEDKLYSLEDTVWAGMGKFRFNGRILHDDKEHGTITFRRSFEQSSNIAVSRFSLALGGKKLYKYARQFGFGQRTGIDLPGEEFGRLRKPRNWSDFWTAQASIGHGLSVTAMQMTSAVGAIANGGLLMRPYVVEETRSETGRLVHRCSPQQIRRVISRETALTLQDLMAGVVDSGTASAANIEEVLFAGKTGTAQKPNFEAGGYHWDKYTASFAGFFPRENPRVAGIVIIDEPQRIHYGGYTAAPAFAEIARRVTLLDKTRKSYVEPRREKNGIQRDLSTGADLRFDSTEATRRTQYMANRYSDVHEWIAASHEAVKPTIDVRIDRCRDRLCEGTLPDMNGLSARDAVVLLSNAGCRVEVNGSGRVKSQSPEAGSRLDDVDRVVLWCLNDAGG